MAGMSDIHGKSKGHQTQPQFSLYSFLSLKGLINVYIIMYKL